MKLSQERSWFHILSSSHNVDVVSGERGRWTLGSRAIVNQTAQRRPSDRIEKLSKKLVTLTSLEEFVILTELKISCTRRVHIERGCVT